MVSREIPKVFTYGFEPGETERWTNELELRPVSLERDALNTLPGDVPVVVHIRQAAALARLLEDVGMLNDLILFVPEGAQIPAGAYYEAIVSESRLPRLKQLVEHPEQLRISRMAEGVPLRLLNKPVQALNLQMLGLSKEDAAHLATCPICPGLLRNALRERIRLYQQLSCPTPEVLIEQATGLSTSAIVQAHIKECPFCKAQIEALQATLGVNRVPNYMQRELFRTEVANKPIAHRTKHKNLQMDEKDPVRNGLIAAFGV
ncbi:MAG: hypothetical protein ABJA50_06325, partial [Chloroflexota bacterium]